MLPALSHGATTAAVLASGTGLLYGTVLAFVAVASVLARTPERRRDARSTLTTLIRWRRSR
ncbi:hypothetical protein [Kitasatospora sp. NPDC057500]|uniref:hypothetical protein n=1 Tax=Kitasatospora sp. NPDC057500 TaxID=3346151 RepID=UPI003689EDEE